jgi:hypothetical protein
LKIKRRHRRESEEHDYRSDNNYSHVDNRQSLGSNRVSEQFYSRDFQPPRYSTTPSDMPSSITAPSRPSISTETRTPSVEPEQPRHGSVRSPTKFPIGQYQEFIRQQREMQENGRESLSSKENSSILKKGRKKKVVIEKPRATSAPRSTISSRLKIK